jgi:phospholipid/cholesterol/gamma-HCH transport system substrate-binding protein
MDLHYQKEITVGTLVLVGVALFMAGTMWLKGTTFHRTQRVELIRFSDVEGLKVDNEVTVSGYAVGKVKTIEFKEPGRVLVTVTLPPELPLKADASASIVSGFFSSDSKLVLDPGSPDAAALPEGSVIIGSVERGIFAKGASLADRADSVLVGVQAIANQKTADELTKTLKSLQRVLDKRLPSTAAEAEKTMVSLRHLTERLDSTLATIPVKNTVERADTLARNLSTMSIQLTATGARLDSLLQRINNGEGTLGKFATDTGLYSDSRAVAQSLKVLIDELNKHPGKITVQVKMF